MTTNSNNIFYLIEVFLISILLLQYHGIDYFVVLLLFRPLCLGFGEEGFGEEGFGEEGFGEEGLGDGDLDDDCCFCCCNCCNSCCCCCNSCCCCCSC